MDNIGAKMTKLNLDELLKVKPTHKVWDNDVSIEFAKYECGQITELVTRLKEAEEVIQGMYKNQVTTIFIEEPEHVEHFFKSASEYLRKYREGK